MIGMSLCSMYIRNLQQIGRFNKLLKPQCSWYKRKEEENISFEIMSMFEAVRYSLRVQDKFRL